MHKERQSATSRGIEHNEGSGKEEITSKLRPRGCTEVILIRVRARGATEQGPEGSYCLQRWTTIYLPDATVYSNPCSDSAVLPSSCFLSKPSSLQEPTTANRSRNFKIPVPSLCPLEGRGSWNIAWWAVCGSVCKIFFALSLLPNWRPKVVPSTTQRRRKKKKHTPSSKAV